MTTKFPIDLTRYVKLSIDPWTTPALSEQVKKDLTQNIQLCRDAIIFFTATGGAKNYGGHTGGPYDTVPEVMLMDAFFRGTSPGRFVPIFFDESGHRVATQYLMSVLHGHMPAEQLMQYRVGHQKMPGHPELGLTPGVMFSSGRLGHMWPYCNGVCMANPSSVVCCLSSDGSLMEGNDAEAARLAVAQQLNIKIFVDDNNVTISGHPSAYMQGYDIVKFLQGCGMTVFEAPGENLDALYRAIRNSILIDGPVAVVIKRKMMPGVTGMEGEIHGHDCIATAKAITYLESRGHQPAADHLKSLKKVDDPYGPYLGSKNMQSNRNIFGETVVKILKAQSVEQRKNSRFFDNDLEGSVGFKTIHDAFPELFVVAGIMERGNFSAAAGFGRQPGKQGIFATFSAFLEMIISEITMARLNLCNVLCHFSHAGVDDMSDNTCHFGLNNFFASNGLQNKDQTRLYFPADGHQMAAVTRAVFGNSGLRFLFSTRSKVPLILTESGDKELFSEANGYVFREGKDDVIREGALGYIVSYGDTVYRCLDAVERLRKEGISIGLIQKTTLNVVDEDMMKKIGQSGLVLVVESLSRTTGLGIRFGTWLLERGFTPKYAHLGIWKEGCGGTWEHHAYQGIDPVGVMNKVKEMLGKK